MGYFKCIVLFALIAFTAVVVAQQAQGGPHEDQGPSHRSLEDIILKSANWTSCDITSDPVLSCHDCHTRLICKPVGGILITCLNPYRPYCVHGVCSPMPSEECANEE